MPLAGRVDHNLSGSIMYVSSTCFFIPHSQFPRIRPSAEQACDLDDLANAAAADRAARPSTRADIAKLKETQGSNQAVAYRFYADPALQLDLKTLFLGSQPLMHAYSQTLEQHKQGQDCPYSFWGWLY